LLTIASWLPLTSFAAVYVRPTWTHASSRGPVPVLVTGVSPDLEQLRPTAGSAAARRISSITEDISVCLGTAETAAH